MGCIRHSDDGEGREEVSREREARWYVYVLKDPRDGSLFYIGKGAGQRDSKHEKDALNPETVCSKKINKIRDIQAANLEVRKERVAFFWDEQAAYDHETDLIEETGLANLTNVLPGGQKAWERRQQERATRRKEPESPPMHAILGKQDSKTAAMLDRFAEWFKFGGHKGRKVSITTTNPIFKWNCRISEAMYNGAFPSIWESIKKDEKALAVLAERLRVYGVELVYGSTHAQS